MTSLQNPTPGQPGQQSQPNKQGLLQNYAGGPGPAGPGMQGGNGTPPGTPVPGRQGGLLSRSPNPGPPQQPNMPPFNHPGGPPPLPPGGPGNQPWGSPPAPVPAGGNPGWNQQRGPAAPPMGGPGGNPNWGPPPAPIPNAPMNMAGVISPQQSAQPLGFEDGQAIIYSTPNFYLRSAYRPGQPLASLRRPSGQTKMMPKVMPAQGDRVASSETRMMPKVDLSEDVKERRNFKLPVPRWLEIVVVLLGIAASFIAHAYNMFNYPRYELDEGTYMSSAWAIWNGMITPYAYGYGHPPLAWMQIAAGLPLVGGFFTFGTAVNTGRVIMLFYAVGCSLLVYLIVRKMSESRAAALLAMVAFSLSPLSITFQRQVFLDNIATFWLLLSLYFLVIGESRLRFLVMSAVALGISFLSKEVFALFIPAMIYGVWIYTTKFQRKFSMVAYIYTVSSVCSAFILMAVLKSELFPTGWLPWDHIKHLSMIGTFTAQAKRGSAEGSVITMWGAWTSGDFLLMIAGVIAPFLNLFMGIWNRKQLFLALLAASFWLLLLRGGVVLSFYIIPLIPFIAINLAVALDAILRAIARLFYFDLMRSILLVFLTLLLIPYYLLQGNYAYTLAPASIQVQAMTWVRSHVPRNAVVVTNSWAEMDLKHPGGLGVGNESAFPNTLVYPNIDDDATVYNGVLSNNPDRIDYFIADSEMLTYITGDSQGKPQGVDPNDPDKIAKWKDKIDQLYGGGLDAGTTAKLLMRAFFYSQRVATFQAKDHNQDFQIDIFQVVHTTGLPQARIAPDHSGNDSHTGSSTFASTIESTTNTGGPIPLDRRTIFS